MSIVGSASCGIDDAVAATLSACDKPPVSPAIIDLTMSSDDEEIDLNRPGLVLASGLSTAIAGSSSIAAGQQTSGPSMSTENMECVLTKHQGTTATCLAPRTETFSAVSRRRATKPLKKPNHQTPTSSLSKSPVCRPPLRRSSRGRQAVVLLPDDSPVSKDQNPRADMCSGVGAVRATESCVCPFKALPVEAPEALEKENTAINNCTAASPDSVQGRVPAPLCDFEKKYRQALHGLMVGAARSARTGKDCADALKLASRKKRCPAGAYPPVNTGHEYIQREDADTIVIDQREANPCPREIELSGHEDLCAGRVPLLPGWNDNTGSYRGEEKREKSPQFFAMLDDHSQQTDSDSFSAASDPPCPLSADDRCGGLEPFADDQPRYVRRRIAKVRHHNVARGDVTVLVRQRLTKDGFFNEISHSQTSTGN